MTNGHLEASSTEESKLAADFQIKYPLELMPVVLDIHTDIVKSKCQYAFPLKFQ